jgi:hypothetical protein
MRLANLAAVLGLFFFSQATQSARAAITFFGLDNPRGTLTNSLQAESDFLTALSSFGTDNVDLFPHGTPDPLLVFGATGVTATAGNTFVDAINFTPVSAPNVLWDGFGNENEVFIFNMPVHGFGTFLLGLGTNTTTTLTYVLENTLLATSQNVVAGPFGPNAFEDNVAYFGVIDAANPFNRVTVQASQDFDFFAFDNLTVGFTPASAAIPEFSSLATWVGLCAMGLFARSRLILQPKPQVALSADFS